MGRLDDYDDIDDMLIVCGNTFVYKGTDTAKMIEEAYNKGKSDAEKEHLQTCDSCIHKVSKEEMERIKADVIEEFETDIINKINFEAKWLFDCKSNNSDTNIAFDALITFVRSRAKQLKEQK